MKKPITFKLAFVVVILLHVGGYFAVSQISAMRLRLSKLHWKQKTESITNHRDQRNSWPNHVATPKVVAKPTPSVSLTTNVSKVATKPTPTNYETHYQREQSSELKPINQPPKNFSNLNKVTSKSKSSSTLNYAVSNTVVSASPKIDITSKRSQSNKVINIKTPTPKLVNNTIQKRPPVIIESVY